MLSVPGQKQPDLDELDHSIIHALRIDGRLPFSRIAEVLNVSTQTIARRYRRLSTEAALRVVGVVDPRRSSGEKWILRLSTRPDTAQRIAESLARRDDTTWVRRMAGGNELCLVTAANSAANHSLLLREIPRTASITSVSAHRLLHTYLGGPTAWQGHTAALSDWQQTQLHEGSGLPNDVDVADPAAPLGLTDWLLLTQLQRNGRTSYADLATETGLSASTVRRRLTALQADGILTFDVEIGAEMYGITTQALLWMSIAPAHLNRAATILSQHKEVAFLASTTGQTNLVALVFCKNPSELHDYLSDALGSLDSIRVLETSPVQKTLKTCSPFLAGVLRTGQYGRNLRGASN
ncbi:Lrp/AsnC family transcriptional regulator [Paenarthrobacter sp. NPDC058040]|uniref:Lrp/AsnC family transcriptional regulator n=1 Tax=unclassified Paenarthrobacter TaxID=2634190 RepID=UPI0036D8AB35